MSLNTLRRYLSLLGPAFAVACTAVTTPVPPSTPWLVPTELPAESMVYSALEAAGTPEANPVMVLESTISDAVTGMPVVADVYIVAGDVARDPVMSELLLG